MKFQLSEIVPFPLEGIYDSETEIWNKNITFEQGNLYQVYAPSGKGKSTFIHLLYNLRQDFTGEVSLDAKPIQSLKPKEWAELRQSQISIVFQDLRLFLNLTLWENIQVKLALHPEITKESILEKIEFLGINHLLDKKVALLSYGERQRTAIVRSLAQPFDFLLLDEPFSHLDEENQKKACQLIEEECRKNKAGMIMTSLGFPYFINFDKKLRL